MTRPLMDSDPTRADVAYSTSRAAPHDASRDASRGASLRPVRVTLGTDVGDARALLARADVTAAVVFDGDDDRPAGVVTAAALRRGQRSRLAATVADVMDYQVVHVPPRADELTTVATFGRAAWASLLRRPHQGRR